MRDLDEIICHCQEITYQTIINAIHDKAHTVKQISDATDAGISCGTCIVDLEEILEEELSKLK